MNIPSEIEGLQYLNLTQELIWNATRVREMAHPSNSLGRRKNQRGRLKGSYSERKNWRMRPDGIAVLPPVGNKAGIFCILEHKRIIECPTSASGTSPGLSVHPRTSHVVRIPPDRHKCGDTASRMEGRTDQLYNGGCLERKRGSP
jgi:hypothetical protein